MAGQPGGQTPMQGLRQHSPGSWNGQEYQGQAYHNGDNSDPRQQMSMGFLKGFPAMQKKTTRGAFTSPTTTRSTHDLDGQVPKRRGPKPDSKPAQTRRQELNRQAQRTHRERKEQYTKALELELDHFKERYVADTNNADQIIQQQQQENALLRSMLASRGVNVEEELAVRNSAMGMTMPIKRDPSSLSPSQMPTRVLPHHQAYLATTPSTAGYSPMGDNPFSNGSAPMSVSGHSPGMARHSPGTTHHSNSPAGPEIQEFSIKQEHEAVPSMPGIFEKDPQLAVDFILQLEHTCRDHGEYLVRKSVASPDDPDEAQISGHALMASIVPVRHVREVPAVRGGLDSTYPHQMVDTETSRILESLLRTSWQAEAAMHLMGGQVTPVRAMQSLRNHRNYQSLNEDDVRRMIDSVKGNVRCYGFGAVMEDFELRDALDEVFATKPEAYESIGDHYSGDIDDMYS